MSQKVRRSGVKIKLPVIAVLTAAIFGAAGRAFTQQISPAPPEGGFTTKSKFLAYARIALGGPACLLATEGWQYMGIDDRTIINTSIYVIERSTDAYCLDWYTAELQGMAQYSGKTFKARKKQWKRAADALTEVMNHPNPDIRAYSSGGANPHIVTPWNVRFGAAQALQAMGPPYQEEAYEYFLNEIGRLARDKRVDDGKRWEAIMLLAEFYFHKPGEASPGFYKKIRHKPPIILFRAVNKNLDLLRFWESRISREGPNGVDRKMILTFRHLVEK